MALKHVTLSATKAQKMQILNFFNNANPIDYFIAYFVIVEDSGLPILHLPCRGG